MLYALQCALHSVLTNAAKSPPVPDSLHKVADAGQTKVKMLRREPIFCVLDANSTKHMQHEA